MQTCPNCRVENLDTSRFCSACGAPLAGSCPTCSADVPTAARFCPSCGTPAAAVSPPPEGEERKVVTVLFADLVDSTAFADSRDPEDVRRVHSQYFARVRAELERFGGTVEKFIGDAVMAVFGAPLAREDDPERAVRAAFGVRDATAELNASLPDAELHVRVGVNTGEAVVALGARPSAGEGMAAGDVVNTASRLQAAAPVDGIYVGEGTYRATTGAIEYRAAPPVQAKGKTEPVAVWQAVAARPEHEPRTPRTPFVGRWHELSTLLDALVRAREHRATQFVSLVGEPGIGKSRLVHELRAAVGSEPGLVTWLHGRCLPYGEGVTFAALAEMARTEAGILRSDTAVDAERKLRATVAAAFAEEAEARRVEQHLRPLVGLDAEGPLRREQRGEAFAAWRRFFERLAERRPLVLVFDDLHWADEGLLDFIDHLVDWASGVPMLVVCTARPELLERRPTWGGGKRNSATSFVSPLSDAETAQLIVALLGRRDLPQDVRDSVVAHAGGNPLYAEEYARMLVDRGLTHNGDAEPAVPPALPLPETVHGIIAARIDGLSAEEKAVLQSAAVVGKTFWLGAVASVVEDAPRSAVEACLHALQRKEFIRREARSSIAGETEYGFRHALVRDVAYEQLPRARRAASHRRAAEWVESLATDREEQVELLAHHYLSALEFARAAAQDTGLLTERARLALREAGDRASRLNAFPAAARFYGAALGLWPPDDVEQAQIRFCLGKALFQQGGGHEVLADARNALVRASDVAAAAEAEALLGVLAAREGRTETASGHVERAGALLQDAPPSAAKAQVLSILAGVLMNENPHEALPLAAEALAMAIDCRLDDVRAHALTTIGFSRCTSGDFGGVDELEQAVAVAEQADSPEIIRSRSMLAVVLAHKGDLARSADARAGAWRAAERFWNPSVIRFLDSERAADSYWSGHWREARRITDEFIGEVEAGLRHYGEMLCRQIRAEIRLASGDVHGALEDAEKTLATARRTGHAQSLFPALAINARVALAAGHPDTAVESVDELASLWRGAPAMPASFWLADFAVVTDALGRANELAELAAAAASPTRWLDAALALASDPRRAAEAYAEIGSRPDEAYARVRAAEHLMARGERNAADRELAAALGFYREVGADAYAREAEALPASV